MCNTIQKNKHPFFSFLKNNFLGLTCLFACIPVEIIIGFLSCIILFKNSKLPNSPEPILIAGTFNFLTQVIAVSECGVHKIIFFFLAYNLSLRKNYNLPLYFVSF